MKSKGKGKKKVQWEGMAYYALDLQQFLNDACHSDVLANDEYSVYSKKIRITVEEL